MYAQYVDHPIPDQNMVNIFIIVVMKCILFNTSYEKLHARLDQKNRDRSNSFLERGGKPQTHLRSHGGQYGFGVNATDTATTEVDAAYEQSVHAFSLTFNKSQRTILG